MREGLMDFGETDPAPAFASLADEPALLDDDVPPAGTACEGCKGLGHWCPAKVYRGLDTPLCRACADGVDCSVVQVWMRRPEEDFMPAMARESCAAGPVRDVTPLDAATRVIPLRPEEVRRNYAAFPIGSANFSVSDERKRAQSAARGSLAGRQSHFKVAAKRERYEPIAPFVEERAELLDVEVEIEEEKTVPLTMSDATIREIQAAPASESNNALAKRLKVGYNTAQKYRKAAPGKSDALARRDTVSSGVPIDMADLAPRVAALGSPLPPTIEGHVAITVAETRLDGWFAKLPAQRKAEIFFTEAGV